MWGLPDKPLLRAHGLRAFAPGPAEAPPGSACAQSHAPARAFGGWSGARSPPIGAQSGARAAAPTWSTCTRTLSEASLPSPPIWSICHLHNLLGLAPASPAPPPRAITERQRLVRLPMPMAHTSTPTNMDPESPLALPHARGDMKGQNFTPALAHPKPCVQFGGWEQGGTHTLPPGTRAAACGWCLAGALLLHRPRLHVCAGLARAGPRASAASSSRLRPRLRSWRSAGRCAVPASAAQQCCCVGLTLTEAWAAYGR